MIDKSSGVLAAVGKKRRSTWNVHEVETGDKQAMLVYFYIYAAQ